ncbi:partitioning defective 6 [Elysia marginata]|uniref:Partitioning defective 6 n=1 Tax=Elysia marginata TaxID=1093978 RepID=A0AAV4J3N8_9GAST|nr:partitioning defective 6 [Elysia marginata]
MSRSSKHSLRFSTDVVEIKSKFDAEFRRFSIDRTKMDQFGDFYHLLEDLHLLSDVPFIITYTDPNEDTLPINNDENFRRALFTSRRGLKIVIQRKGESYGEMNGYGSQPVKKRNAISKLISADSSPKPRIKISLMEDFRRVSAIIDVDIVPESHRRVKLMKNGSDKPLGFYIRDGTSFRVMPHGLEKVPAIFISRLVPGGLAESTGLLAVNDEVLEVNGIDVAGKKLDQVTDMMVANSSNLIITVKPINQTMSLGPQRGVAGRTSNLSHQSGASSHVSHHSQASNVSYHSARSLDSNTGEAEQGGELDDEDEVRDHLSASAPPAPSSGTESDGKPGEAEAAAASISQLQLLKQQQEEEEWFSFTSSPVRTSGRGGSGGAGAGGGSVHEDPIVTL